MIKDLNNTQLELVTELVMHHGMYRYEKDNFRYRVYRDIAVNLLEEVIARKGDTRSVRCLVDEFMETTLKCVKEIEYIPKTLEKFYEKKKNFQKTKGNSRRKK